MSSKSQRQRSVTDRIGEWCVTVPKNWWLRWLPSVAWAGFIFLLSSIPGYRLPKVPLPETDKGMHALLFFPLGFLVARSVAAVFFERPLAASMAATTRLIGAFALCAAYGFLDEVHQIFVPRRSFSLADWAVDCIAAGIGIIAWRVVQRRFVSFPTIGS